MSMSNRLAAHNHADVIFDTILYHSILVASHPEGLDHNFRNRTPMHTDAHG